MIKSNQTTSTQSQPVKRRYKDSLFVHLFSIDRDGRKNFLDLYNVLNGTQAQPAKQTLSLREAFSDADIFEANAANTLLALSVTVYNINGPDGKSEREKCKALLDYSRFVSIARDTSHIPASTPRC